MRALPRPRIFALYYGTAACAGRTGLPCPKLDLSRGRATVQDVSSGDIFDKTVYYWIVHPPRLILAMAPTSVCSPLQIGAKNTAWY